NDRTFRQIEEEMFDDFRKQSASLLGTLPATPLDWLALAQHHRMPTRLLDWSANALAALWFTVSERPPEKENGAVWIFRTRRGDWINRKDKLAISRNVLKPPRVFAFMPGSVTRRVTTQMSFFTIHPDRKGQFEPLDKIRAFRSRLLKIAIAREAFVKLRVELDHLGINRYSIFPDLEGLAQHAAWYHFKAEDET